MAFLDFSQDELGDPLSEEEKVGERPAADQRPVCCGATEVATAALGGPFDRTVFL